MPEIKLTTEEEKIFLLIKRYQLKFEDCKNFCEIFCIALEKKVFDCKGGEKILRFDASGKLRRIESHKIDWLS